MQSRFSDGGAATGRRHGGRMHWLPCLLLCLLLCPLIGALSTAALAAPTSARVTEPASATSRYLAPLGTDYRVIQLAAGTIGSVGINARGQVGFTDFTGGAYRARFYDGDTIHDTGTLGGGSATFMALNDHGQVAGGSTTADGSLHAFRWSLATGLQDLHAPGMPGNSSGSFINNKGWVAGWARPTWDVMPRAFRWTPAAGMVSLGAFGEASEARAINDAGTVVGFSDTPGAYGRAFAWTEAGGLRAVDGASGIFSLASDINEAGTIVGRGSDYQFIRDIALLWTPQGTQIDLGAGSGSSADRINEKGLVIGQANDEPNANRSHGFVWSPNHGMVKLGAVGGDASYASSLNNRGQVVGALGNRAIAWTRAGGVVDLNTRIPGAPPALSLYQAVAVSDSGAIAALANTGLVLLVPSAAYHQAPVAAPIALTGATRVHSLLSFSSAFKDVDVRETHTAHWTWGDGDTAVGIVSEAAGTGSVSGQHMYRKSGIFTVRLDLFDSGGKRTAVERRLAICGCASGVAGTGSFLSPQGAATRSPNWSGIASFAFLSEAVGAYAKQGKSEVHFNAGSLALRSTAVDSVTVEGGRVRYSGSGSVNGVAGYRFVLTALAGEGAAKGHVHVRIAHVDTHSKAEVVDYDNGVRRDGKTAHLVAGTGAGAGAEGSTLLGDSAIVFGEQ